MRHLLRDIFYAIVAGVIALVVLWTLFYVLGATSAILEAL